MTTKRYLGSDIRGISLGNTGKTSLSKVTIGTLESQEGAVLGIEVTTDTSDRSDYDSSDITIDYNTIQIMNLKG